MKRRKGYCTRQGKVKNMMTEQVLPLWLWGCDRVGLGLFRRRNLFRNITNVRTKKDPWDTENGVESERGNLRSPLSRSLSRSLFDLDERLRRGWGPWGEKCWGATLGVWRGISEGEDSTLLSDTLRNINFEDGDIICEVQRGCDKLTGCMFTISREIPHGKNTYVQCGIPHPEC